MRRRPSLRDEPDAAFLVVLLGGAAVAHVVRPEFFEPMVPDVLPGTARTWNLASAGVEALAALLLAVPPTRRVGGWLAAATFVGVLPANVQAAVNGGYPALPAPLDGPVAAWLRLPLQVPLIWLGVRVARRDSPGD